MVSGNAANPPNFEYLAPVFLFLLVAGGQVGLPIIVCTAIFSRRLAWHPTLINFCVTWIVYSVVYCLYLYSGGNRENPPSRICIVQASMVHGAAPMAAVGGLLVVIHTWAMVQHFERYSLERMPRTLRMVLMIAPPYVVFLAFSISAGILGSKYSKLISAANGLYCTTDNGLLDTVVPSFCAVVMFLVLCFEVAICVQYLRRRILVKRAFPLAERPTSRSSVFRVGLFCAYSFIALTTSILFSIGLKTAPAFMFPAALPSASTLVFGLQKDIVAAWFPRSVERKLSAATALEIPNARLAQRPFSFSTLSPNRLSALGATWDCSSPMSASKEMREELKIALSPIGQAPHHWRRDTELAIMRILYNIPVQARESWVSAVHTYSWR
ncbi:hypothetical protein BV22DRAFT_63183 [Leucogyrophana mollusca]|uniref:Uncharacterized protein n=1 Tax=Leucogyrophana mollusca TaxID=85980 RepID=A0ACB8BY34_9AGAM|nr:hypothetical protein BV22DRAFT_63183 [Leucogyrophana mollusca]